MNPKIREDVRLFREFYPDPAKRSQVHYAFAHRFLPQYVSQNPHAFFSYLFRRDLPGSPMEPVRFIHSRWTLFEEVAGLIPRSGFPTAESVLFRRVTALSMSVEQWMGRPVALVRMPVPEHPANAICVVVVLLASIDRPENWPRDVQARVFTLEAVELDSGLERERGLLCEWTGEGQHLNFGIGATAKRDDLLNAVARVMEDPDRFPKAGYSRKTP